MILLALACTVTPREQFVGEVVPMLDRSCGSTACHGLASGEQPPLPGFFYTVDGEGRVVDTDQVYSAALEAIDTVDPQYSSLYRKPLGTVWGGQPHFGGANFVTPDAADARALLDWIE